MFTSLQSKAFMQAYDNYRIILRFLKENMDMTDMCKGSFQEVVKVADLELQRMLWDVSSLDANELSAAEQEFIKAIIEYPDILKVSVPGYFQLYRNMTSANYKTFFSTLVENTNDIPLGVRTAIELIKQTDKNYVVEMINAYQEILSAYLEMNEQNQEERHGKAKMWVDNFIKTAVDNGISYETDESSRKTDSSSGLGDIIQDLNNLFKQQGLT